LFGVNFLISFASKRNFLSEIENVSLFSMITGSMNVLLLISVGKDSEKLWRTI